ncbi:unnamed protein product [Microthlaspi erraticum]|uniref:DC1 domain-containing protein n=1 Tax=Microthlaspi erraticum TaxID=1685480 RepID=A0A6D2HLG7_9BRAS|nr:unnamed protein product [Microthlaspi erraticum]
MKFSAKVARGVFAGIIYIVLYANSICYKCATIPDEIYHKYDEHPLSLCYGKSGVDEDEVWWCEVCEKRLDPREWFYTTNSSDQRCTTIHHECLFGDSALFKAGHIFSDMWKLLVTIVALVPFVVSVIAVADILYTSKCIVGTVRGMQHMLKKLRFFVLFFVSQKPLGGAPQSAHLFTDDVFDSVTRKAQDSPHLG